MGNFSYCRNQDRFKTDRLKPSGIESYWKLSKVNFLIITDIVDEVLIQKEKELGFLIFSQLIIVVV